MPVAPVQVSADVAPILDRLTQGLQWLERKQMYVWKAEYTIEQLQKTRNELDSAILDVLAYMLEARRNGWSLKHRAECWVLEGRKIMEHADKTVTKFYEQLELLRDPSSSNSIIQILSRCPCEALSRRVLNAEAVTRLIDIKEHEKQGGIYLTGSFREVASNNTEADDPRTRTSQQRIDELLALAPAVPKPAAAPSPLLANEHKPISSDNGFDAPQPSVNKALLLASAADIHKLKLSAFTKYHALARSQSHESVPVMIRVKAPRYARGSRAPIDLVMLLDISAGADRLEEVKQGAIFIVHNLEAEDRLSILQMRAHRLLFPLTYMSDQHKSMAKTKIAADLFNHGPTTHVMPAMKTAYQILKERSDKNRVSSIMLLTDSFDKTVGAKRLGGGYPTYTLGIGSDHDAGTMYTLATQGRGTYSFVDAQGLKSIRNAMALCIGGLSSIVAQRVKISIDSAQQDVRISRITCGAYDHVVEDGKTSGSITVHDLCGNEEKNFLVYVKVPAAQGAIPIMRKTSRTTKLLTVTANYYCPLTKRADVTTDSIEVSVKRPIKVRGQPSRNICVQVASEVIRANVFGRVNDIWHDEDLEISNISNKLNKLQGSIRDTEEAKLAKDRWEDLSMDLDDMQDSETGLPCMLSWLSSHQWQRAATTGSSSTSTSSFSFRTIRMHNMMDSVESAPVYMLHTP